MRLYKFFDGEMYISLYICNYIYYCILFISVYDVLRATQAGFTAAAMHGGKSQETRNVLVGAQKPRRIPVCGPLTNSGKENTGAACVCSRELLPGSSWPRMSLEEALSTA